MIIEVSCNETYLFQFLEITGDMFRSGNRVSMYLGWWAEWQSEFVG
jgi:hypothetical protein